MRDQIIATLARSLIGSEWIFDDNPRTWCRVTEVDFRDNGVWLMSTYPDSSICYFCITNPGAQRVDD